MNRLFRSVLIAMGVLFFVSVAASGGEDNWRYSAKEIESLKKEYPEADAVMLKQAITIEMDEKGLISRSVMRRVALFTDNAIRRYGDPRLVFDSSTQELDVSVARVYMRDGTAVDCRENAFNQTTPFAFAPAPDYTNWQETVVTHVGIEKDCVAELHYAIRDTEKRKPWLSGVEHLALADPALDIELTIAVPAGVELKHASAHGVSAPEQRDGGIYRWKIENVPAAVSVDGGVWRGDYLPTVVFSTARDWLEVSDYVEALFEEYAVLSSGTGEDTGSELTEERILEIHGEAVDCVRGIDAPFALFDSAPRTAERIYQSAYAHSLDRAVLLKGKLAQAGIESVPCLVSGDKTWPASVAAPELFEWIYLQARVPDSEETLLLDPENRFIRDPRKVIPGFTFYRCDGGGRMARVPVRQSADNRSFLELTLTVNDEGKIIGEGSATLRGAFSPYYSIKGLKNETEDFAKSRVEGMFPSGSLKSWNIRTLEKHFVEIGFSFEAELPEETEAGRIYLTLPEPFMAHLSGIDGIHLERSACPVPVRVMPCDLELSVVFEEFPGWDIFGEPLEADVTNSVGSVKTTTENGPSGSDSKVVLTKSLVIDNGYVPSEDYGKLRSLLLRYNEGQIIFSRSASE